MKKRFFAVLTALLLIFALTACGEEDSTAVAVQKVSDITGLGSVGVINRYAGVVVSGESAEVKKDEDKKVLEVFVAEGDMVQTGDPLFSYDMEAMQLSLKKLQLELEEINNTISSAEEEIPRLENLKLYARGTDLTTYSLQIQSLEADLLEAKYNLTIKERDIAALEASLEDSQVYAPISGRVMSVNSGDESSYSVDGSQAFITITDVDTCRVKGVINEMNVGQLFEGMPVLIRSRLDESITWSGMLYKIDWENTYTDSSSSNYYYYDYSANSGEMTSSSKYAFYVSIDDPSALLMGQHVFIEPDYGQNEQVEDKLMLPVYYVCTDDSGSYVWARDSRNKLEKRTVTLGEEDIELGTVEILSGLTVEDYIAFPEDGLTAGMNTADYSEGMFSDGTVDEYYDYSASDDVYMDEGFSEDLTYDDSEVFAEDDMAASEGSAG